MAVDEAVDAEEVTEEGCCAKAEGKHKAAMIPKQRERFMRFSYRQIGWFGIENLKPERTMKQGGYGEAALKDFRMKGRRLSNERESCSLALTAVARAKRAALAGQPGAAVPTYLFFRLVA